MAHEKESRILFLQMKIVAVHETRAVKLNGLSQQRIPLRQL